MPVGSHYPARSASLTNEWDALGNRTGLTLSDACSYSFIYNPIAGVPAVIEEIRTGSNAKTYYYYRDPSGLLIARKDATISTSWQYYHYDELGSTRLLTDNSGNETDTYAYDAYGNVIAHNGPTTDNPYQFVGALGYYTHTQAPEFGLIQTGFRFYDPEAGRYTQQDPNGDGINWYAYCGGNPMAGVDPWGLSIGEPPLLVSFIPVVGSAWSAINDFQNGNYLMGTVNAALAVSDAVGVGAAAKTIGKMGVSGLRVAFSARGAKALLGIGGWKGKNGIRAVLGEMGIAGPKEIVHHFWPWMHQNEGVGKNLPRMLVNGIWNLNPLGQDSRRVSSLVHYGKYLDDRWGLGRRIWYNFPTWVKVGVAELVLRNVPRGDDINCPE